MKEKFFSLLKKKFVTADGGFGTLLNQILGDKTYKYEKELSDGSINFCEPEAVRQVSRAYAKAGSDIIMANTFSVNPLKTSEESFSCSETVIQALRLAKEAVSDYAVPPLIALDVTTLGQMLEPAGDMTFETAFELYRIIMDNSGINTPFSPDLIVIETMSSLLETKAAVLAAKECRPDLPVICSFTITENGRTFTGTDTVSAAVTLSALGIDAIGMNCSFGPLDFDKIMLSCAEEIMRVTDIPLWIKPNAGLPDPITAKFPLSPDEFGMQMKEFAEAGVKILGGCCGTTPDFISAVKKNIEDVIPVRTPYEPKLRVCSGLQTVELEKPVIVGERINPNGKPKFRTAIKEGNYRYITGEASAQKNAGAHILDINVAVADSPEKETMLKSVSAVQAVNPLPLMIDSNDPEVIEAALRIYEGKAIINSVNGEKRVMDKILPLAKKYGAAAVALTLDGNGIPPTSAGRLEIAKRIVFEAEKYGIPRTDIIIDCLTMTAATDQQSAAVTLDSIRAVKSVLGVKTILGASNISFGLPERDNINVSFITLALAAGLDLVIMNPLSPRIKAAFDSYLVLSGADTNCAEYSKIYASNSSGSSISDSFKLTEQNSEKSLSDLTSAVIGGYYADSVRLTSELLEGEFKHSPFGIAEKHIIPALDIQGKAFENQEIFLPALILSADAASACFELLRGHLVKNAEKSENSSEKSNKIVIATVKGDIHDIGKNIVKAMLMSYGYTVIDLGKNVPPSEVLCAAKREGAKLVGLSSLMTTTLPAMEETVKLIKSQLPECKIMLGGAVVTEEYALRTGADFYSSTAKGAADIANRLFGNQSKNLTS